MNRRLIAAAASIPLAAGAVLVPQAWASPPANDAFSDAQPVVSVPFEITAATADATVEAGEPQPSCAPTGATTWYRVELSESTDLTIRTAGSDFDTVVAVYRGDGLSDLVEVACDDDGGQSFTSSVHLAAKRLTTYWVQVGGYLGDHGDLHLEMVSNGSAGAGLNDDRDSAIVVGQMPFEHQARWAEASLEPGELTDCTDFSGFDRSVWYQVTTETDVAVVVAREFTGPVGLYDDSGRLTCAYGQQPAVRLTAGTTYWLQVGLDWFDPGYHDTETVRFEAFEPPQNDLRSAAAPLRLGDDLEISTVGATTEASEPGCDLRAADASFRLGEPESTVWYRFEPDDSRPVVITAEFLSSDGYPSLNVYEAGTGATVDCSTLRNTGWERADASFVAEAGKAYLVQVGQAYFADPGSMRLRVRTGAAAGAVINGAAVAVDEQGDPGVAACLNVVLGCAQLDD